MRCGLPRLFEVLGSRGIQASAWMNAQCAASAGWDFVGHSWFSDPEKALDLPAQRTDTIFVTSGQIADWFVAADKTGPADLEAALKMKPGQT
jgi:hypothetical protein